MTHIKHFITALLLALFLILPASTHAQESPGAPAAPKEEVVRGKIIQVVREGERDILGHKNPYQIVKVRIMDGPEKDKILTIHHGEQITIQPEQKVKAGETVVVLKLSGPQNTQYLITDKYRLGLLPSIILFFFLLIFVLSGWRGLGSILGLMISLLVIMQFIVPQILSGQDPFLVSVIGSLFIMTTTIYLAHGFSTKTHIALFSTFISLILVGIFATICVELVKLTGMGSEEAYSLKLGLGDDINFRGLLLGGIIIGALGVLDDITTSLSATIAEIAKANPTLSFGELVRSGMRVGSEHIASLVNTLVLAYAGAGLPIFLFIVINPLHQPLWAILNSQMVTEEIVRTLAGSMGLVMAVPITTILAAWVNTEFAPSKTSKLAEKSKANRFVGKTRKK